LIFIYYILTLSSRARGREENANARILAVGANGRGYGSGGGDTGGGGGRMVEAEVTRAARIGAPQGRENGVRECDEDGGSTEEGERSSERERRTCTDDPEI